MPEIPQDPYSDPDTSLWQILKEEVRSHSTEEGQAILDQERRVAALHETGHAMIALLMRMPIKNIQLGHFQLRAQTQRKLFKVLGPLMLPIMLMTGSNISPHEASYNFFSKYVTNEVILFALAGLANNVAQGINSNSERYLTHWLATGHLGSKVTAWTDISYPREYVQYRLHEATGEKAREEDVRKIIQQVFDELVKLFQQTRFQKAIEAISKRLFEHGEIANKRLASVDDQLKILLEAEGIDEDVLNEMYLEMAKIDVDTIIDNLTTKPAIDPKYHTK